MTTENTPAVAEQTEKYPNFFVIHVPGSGYLRDTEYVQSLIDADPLTEDDAFEQANKISRWKTVEVLEFEISFKQKHK